MGRTLSESKLRYCAIALSRSALECRGGGGATASASRCSRHPPTRSRCALCRGDKHPPAAVVSGATLPPSPCCWLAALRCSKSGLPPRRAQICPARDHKRKARAHIRGSRGLISGSRVLISGARVLISWSRVLINGTRVLISGTRILISGTPCTHTCDP